MKIVILGSDSQLAGRVEINGSKNSALPILAASLLTSEEIRLVNIPNIDDVVILIKLLEQLGANVNFNPRSGQLANHTLTIQCDSIQNATPCQKLCNKLRASFLLLGPLLARFGSVTIGLPGGCNIGQRSVDLHLDAFRKMGAKIIEHENDCSVEVFVGNSSRRLNGAIIKLTTPSVGATENILMAATLAEGTTIIKNASIDPDVLCLTKFLVKLGARIHGVGTRKLTIYGVNRLHGCNHYKLIPDRIEAATYATFVIATAGALELVGVERKHLGTAIIKKLVQVGGKITFRRDRSSSSVIVSRKADDPIRPVWISTNPFPKFPTDLQSQFCALLCFTGLDSQSSQHGFLTPTSIVQENVFENRFQHVEELQKLGADIEFLSRRGQETMVSYEIEHHVGDKIPNIVGLCQESTSASSVIIYGSPKGLHGGTVKAHDLRGAAALVLAGLGARGETVIEDFQHLLRGYERMDVKLKACGAKVEILP